MSRFTEPLVVTPRPDGKTWILLCEFGYEVGQLGSNDLINVHVGFHTDFASIPRVFWIFLPRWGKYGNAAVIHDFLYWEQTRKRPEADRILLEGMTVLDVHFVKKYLIYWSVRRFGWWAWWRNEMKRARSKLAQIKKTSN